MKEFRDTSTESALISTVPAAPLARGPSAFALSATPSTSVSAPASISILPAAPPLLVSALAPTAVTCGGSLGKLGSPGPLRKVTSGLSMWIPPASPAENVLTETRLASTVSDVLAAMSMRPPGPGPVFSARTCDACSISTRPPRMKIVPGAAPPTSTSERSESASSPCASSRSCPPDVASVARSSDTSPPTSSSVSPAGTASRLRSTASEAGWRSGRKPKAAGGAVASTLGSEGSP
jgi:hypothetical protein